MFHLLTLTHKALLRIWAEGSPFDMKDELKKRGYRWNDGLDGRRNPGTSNCKDGYEAELKYLRHQIYRRDVEPFIQGSRRFERFRAASNIRISRNYSRCDPGAPKRLA